MKEMIYYPGFEIMDENWLKFALLYFDVLHPIMPDSLDQKEMCLSKKFQIVMDETDLIDRYSPSYEHKACAFRRTYEEIKKYLEDPKIYNIYFPVKNNENIIEKWKNKNNKKFILFREKYSQNFFEFCIKSKLGEECDEGIKISYDIAYLYMSYLANCISRSNGYEIITDEKIYSDFLVHDDLILLKINKNKISNVYNKISLELPANISDIKLETIINLRKNNDFNNYRRAYIHEIDKILDCKEGNKESSLHDMLTYKKEFLKICG